MNSIYKVSSILLIVMLSLVLPYSGLKAQTTNIAPTATITASPGCNTGACSTLNDQNYGTCGTQQMWISGTGGTGMWIEWNWSSAQSFDKLVIHHGETGNRFLSGFTVQNWNGSTWVDILKVTGLSFACTSTINFNSVTTSRFRIYDFVVTGSQSSNPNFREIEIFNSILSGFDVEMASIDAPQSWKVGTNNLTVTYRNARKDTIKWVDLGYKFNNGTSVIVNNVTYKLDPGKATQYTFSTPITVSTAGTYSLKVWVNNANDSMPDNVPKNDTLSVNICTGKSGNFTIGGTGANYATITAAINDLKACGVSGPIVYDLAAITFNERVMIPQILGMSATNTVTFKGKGITNSILSATGTTTTDRSTLVMNGADYFIFKNMRIRNLGATYAVAVLLTNNANYNLFDSCMLDVPQSTSSYTIAVLASGSEASNTAGINANYNIFSNNAIKGGYYAIYYYGGGSTSPIYGNKFINNIITDMYYYGMYFYYCGENVIQYNTVKNYNSSATTAYGIVTYYGTKSLIDGNIVQSPCYGLYVYYENYYYTSNTSQVSNNLVGRMTYSYHYGIYSYYNYNVSYYHNTVWLNNTGSNSAAYSCLYMSSPYYCKVKNNIFVNTGIYGSICYITGGIWNAGDIDYNDYYGPSSNYFVYWNGAYYANLAAWQSGISTQNQNSWSQDPGLTSPTDLHLTGFNPIMWAANLGITNDVDKEVRKTTGLAIIGGDQPQPMTVDSISLIHFANMTAFQGQTNAKIARVKFFTKGAIDAPVVTKAWFRLNGITDITDISAVNFFNQDGAPLQATKLIKSFSTASTSIELTFPTGSDLSIVNTIVVAYDVKHTAKAGNFLDCVFDSITLNGVNWYPKIGNPAGTVEIVHPGSFTYYCDVTRTTAGSYAIGTRKVKFGSINNSTATLAGGIAPTNTTVQFYTTPVPVVYRKVAYPIAISHGELNTQSAAIFIDWNNDGYFDISTESVISFSNVLEASISNANIMIPCNATTGIHRMRIVSDQLVPAACGAVVYGETEDYLIEVPAETKPVLAVSYPDTAFVKGITKFNPSVNNGGKIIYVWDYNNTGNFSDTAAVGSYSYTTAGKKTFAAKAILQGCVDTLISNPFSGSLMIINPPSAPVVNFISNFNTVTSSIPVTFTDLSTLGPNKWVWEITPDSVAGKKAYNYAVSNTVQNPTVTFSEIGTYTVKLTATNNTGTASVTKTDYITVVKEMKMCTDIATTQRSGYLYDDGGRLANYANPVVVLEKTCGFTITPKCATAITLDILDLDIASNTISTCALLNGDALRIYDGKNNKGTPLHLQFKDIYGNIIYPNGFSNGPQNVQRALPPSVSANSGSMYIEFFANCGAVGSGFEAKWATTIYVPAKPQAVIDAPDTMYVGQNVFFKSKSIAYQPEYDWDFTADGWGDKFDSMNTWVFNTAGTYNIRLIVRSCDFYDTVFKKILIIAPTKKPVVNFVADFTNATTQDEIAFTDKSDKSVISWRWEFSPNYFSYSSGNKTSQNIKGKFTKTGLYTVKLVATNAKGSDSLTKSNYVLIYDLCKPAVAKLSTDIGIASVLLTNIAHDTLIYQQSTIGSSAYTDYSNKHRAYIAKQAKYPITIARNTNFNNMTTSVYIDFNQNGDFDDPGEKVADNPNSSALSWSFDLQIPATAQEGLARLRVATNTGQVPNKGCGPNFTGEFEDYSVIITKDVFKPIITLDGGANVILNSCATFVDPGYHAWDNEAGDLTSSVIVSGTINNTQAGTYYLKYNVSDPAGNKAVEVIRLVQVLADIVKPTITLKGKNPDSVAVFGTYTDASYTPADNCSGVKKHSWSNGVNTAVVGWYKNTFIVQDNAGNIDTIYRNVYVYDDIDPTISLLGNDPLYVEVKTALVDPGASTTDNYYTMPAYTTSNKVNMNVIGSYFITYCVTDSSGNGPVCVDRKVIVEDKTSPNIALKGDAVMTIDVFSNYKDPGVDVSDNYYSLAEGSVIVKISGNVNTFVLGTYIIKYQATDASGNISAEISRTVNVIDRVAPEIDLLGPQVALVERWKNFVDDGYKLSDNYYPASALTVTLNANGSYPGNTFEEGMYTYSYKVCDPSNNCSAEIFRIIYVAPRTDNIPEFDLNSLVKIFPNPADKEVSLSVDLPANAHLSIDVYNTLGEKVMQIFNGNVQSLNRTLNVENLSSGVYYVRFMLENNQTLNEKLIIAR